MAWRPMREQERAGTGSATGAGPGGQQLRRARAGGPAPRDAHCGVTGGGHLAGGINDDHRAPARPGNDNASRRRRCRASSADHHSRSFTRRRAIDWLCSWHTRDSVTPSTAAHVIFDQTATMTGVTTYPAQRALDTRRSPKPAARSTVQIHLGQPNTVYVGNLTITQPATAGYATIYPCAAGLPPTSNINFAADQTVANLAITTSDANGNICVTPSTAAHIIFDHSATLASIRRCAMSSA